ncbi:MAG: tRNA 2-selenouridine(34) synthase MnmH [Rhodobacteraceae bacterium]|nr:tRNA 2-selenouridine(34) synthase MnmH [Paracoccaceae bacterium]
MALTLTSLPQIAAFDFDAVIDVRSPSEFAEDHLPGAINLPVLDDAERARVGTIYKQQSPFLARKVGAALVAKNAARHLEGPLADLPGSWRPLVYCWRGGQRSGSFASILSQVGWRVDLVQGGYKAWRKLVVEEVQEAPVRAPVVVLDGNTGSAKTEILSGLAARGLQTIDLEGLANHRGSLFGGMPGGQPAQKAFEGRLAMQLAALDPSRPVVIEAESSRVGDLSVPKQLWAAMGAAPRLRLAVPATARAAYLARAYADMTVDAARLGAVIEQLRPVHAAEVIESWHGMAEGGRFEALAADLMIRHYDPRYEKHRARFARDTDVEIAAESLAPGALDGIVARVADAVAALSGRG